MKNFSLVALAATILGALAFFALDSSSSSSQKLASSIRRQLTSLTLVGNNGSPSSAFPLGECQGDCDSDDDCDGDLVCFQRNGGQSVPGCSGNNNDNWDYCIRPETYTSTTTTTSSSAPSVQYVGNNGNPDSAFPLGLCQGDCDSDSDCQSGLICFQRDAGEAVPGCAGGPTDQSNADYCIDPNQGSTTTSTPAPTTTGNGYQVGSTSDSFALKVYWQQGYTWQGETIERKWCLRCDSTRPECSPGRRVYLTDCDTDMTTDWQFLYLPDGSFFIKMIAADLCLTAPSNTQDRYTVEYCDSNNERQMYFAGGDASWGGKFEIHPIWAPDGCVANTHHPKFGESLYLWQCAVSRGSETSQWNFY